MDETIRSLFRCCLLCVNETPGKKETSLKEITDEIDLKN